MSKMSLIVIAALTVISAAINVIITYYYRSEPDTVQMLTILLVLMVFIFVGMFDTGFFTFDENRLWQNFAASSPLSFKAQAQSKYVLMLAINLFVVFVFNIADCIIPLVAGSQFGFLTSLAFLMFSVQIITCAIEIPFMVRFGSQKGVNVKLSVFGIILLAVGIYLLFGDISFLFEGDILNKLLTFSQSGGMVWIMALLPYFALTLYFLSYKISTRLYRKGAEKYE